VRPVSGMVLTAALLLAAWNISADTPFNPHGDPQTGVLRDPAQPRGQCQQCHPPHGDAWEPSPYPLLLFTENTNQLAFWDQGAEPCHRRRPQNYPLGESDRMPESEPDAGYFEANTGGERLVGVDYRGRWPGETVYTDPGITPAGRFFSPHAQDPDMPERDASGEGRCENCHDPHGTPNRRDLLVKPYGGIGGHSAVGPPEEYALCFSCHDQNAPGGMDPRNRNIADYYDAGLNGEHAGHQIRKDSRVALSWPANIQVGDMLPCYDCHNPHGSEGHNRVEPNGYLISDQRVDWSGLTDTLNDPGQCRRFCFGCHIASDGIPGAQTVEGIVMNTLSDRGPHRTAAAQSCHDCHGRDYSGPTAHNVHNPGDPGGCGMGSPSPWGP
jgi:hypothetical protein